MALLIYFAGRLNENGKIKVGEVSSFLIYMIMLTIYFAMIAGVFTNIMKIIGASDTICALMEY